MNEEIPVSDLRPSKEVQEFEPFQPLLDRILVRRADASEYVSGFTIPKKYREPEAKGVVIAIGDGVVLGGVFYPMSKFLNVGDHVLFGAMTSEKIALDDKEFEIIRIQDCRGVERLKHEQPTTLLNDFVCGKCNRHYDSRDLTAAKWHEVGACLKA